MGLLQTMISQPEEVAPLLQMAWAAHKAKQLPKETNLAFCYDMLNRVSRRCTPEIVRTPARLCIKHLHCTASSLT